MVGALSISPLFSFPFYGHLVSELFVTTHGFLSLSPRLHDYIYKTQYIAPLRIKVSLFKLGKGWTQLTNLAQVECILANRFY